MSEEYTGLSCTFLGGTSCESIIIYPKKSLKKRYQAVIPGIVLEVEDRVMSKADHISYLISLRKGSWELTMVPITLRTSQNSEQGLIVSLMVPVNPKTSPPTTLRLHSLPSSHAGFPRCLSMQ